MQNLNLGHFNKRCLAFFDLLWALLSSKFKNTAEKDKTKRFPKLQTGK
jgi:hypothetical protein